MPAPPVRVYLDQKLKFWMAFVGAVTLFYLSVLDSRLLFPPTAPAFVLLVVHPDHKSSNAQSLLQYADSAGYEVLALESNRDWARELSTAINSHPKKRNARVLLLVNQEVDFANLSQPAKLRQVASARVGRGTRTTTHFWHANARE
ncbi:hypothetical protein BASA82_000126 [Batrachochytrium salamandrivorans]|nr:hypothetical protein BASA82_000126 [Batrachochytrium salamandrivorans]